MPITNPTEREQLKQAGFDPDQFDDPINQLNQTQSDQQAPVVKSSALGAGLRSALSNLAPSSVGLGTSVALSELTPFVSIPAGVGAGMLTKYLQDKLVKQLPVSISKPIEDTEARDIQDQPVASAIGGVASSLPFLRPDFKSLATVGKSLVTGNINPETANVIKNLALNAGLQTGIGATTKAIQQGTLTPELDRGDVVNALGGALLNRPTTLGNRIGLGHSASETPIESDQQSPVKSEGLSGINLNTVEPSEYQSQETGVGNLNQVLVDQQNQSEVGALSRIQNTDMVQEANRKAQEEATLKQQEETKILQDRLDAIQKESQAQAEEYAKQFKHEQTNPDIAYRKDFNSITPEDTTETINAPRTESASISELTAQQKKAQQDQALVDSLKIAENKSQQAAKSSVIKYFDEDSKVAIHLGMEPETFNALPDTAKSVLRQKVSEDLNQQKMLENSEIGKTSIDNTSEKLIPTSEELPHDNGEFDVGKKEIKEPYKYQGFQQSSLTDPTQGLHLYNLTEDVPGVGIKNSTVSENSLRKAGFDPKPIEPSLLQKLHDSLDLLKVKTDGKLYGGVEGLTTAAWNGSIDAVKLAIKGGAKLTEAVKSGIDWIKKNHPKSKFDENSYHANVMSHLLSQAKLIPQQVNTSTPTTPNARGIHASFMSPEVDKVSRLGPIGKEVAEHMTNFYEKNVENYGKYVNGFTRKVRELSDLGGVVNTLKNPKQNIEQNTPELKNVLAWFDAKADKTTPPTLTPKEEAIKNEFVRSNNEVRRDQITKGIGDKTSVNPDYLAQSFDPKVLQEIKQNPESTKTQGYKKAQIDYLKKKGLTDVQANEKWKEIAESNSKIKSNTSGFFGPIDESAGLGIAKELRNPNIIDTQTKYLDRVARRFAYEDTIKPHEEKINSIGDTTPVKTVMDDIQGNKYRDDSTTSAITGLVSSQMMGTLTGEKDFAGNFTLGWQHTDPVTATKNMIRAWGNMKQNLEDGYASGRIRNHMKSLELDNGIDNFTDLAHKIRDVTNAVTGRNWFDQMARASSMGQAKFITDDFLQQLNKDKLSKTGENWFNTFGKDINWKSGDLSKEEMLKISGRYVDSTQGTYDYRGLPRQSVEGSWSPILRLARWNIEKSNNFIKHTVNPTLNGNIKPALMTTLGVLVGGSIIQAIMQANTGRKNKAATLKEIYQNSNKPSDAVMPLFYKLAGLTSAAGHLGLVGDLIGGAVDKLYGKNRPQAYNNIVLEAGENLATLTGNYINTLAQDGPSTDHLVSFISQVVENTSQNYRLLEGVLSQNNKDEVDKSNKVRDLRVFNTMNGNKINDLTSPFEVKLEDSKVKEFRNETDVNKIAEQSKALVERAQKRAGNDPAKLDQELRSLKGNSYQTLPNPEDATQEKAFQDYIKFLVKTQGKDAAIQRVQDWIKHNAANELKSDLIPSVE